MVNIYAGAIGEPEEIVTIPIPAPIEIPREAPAPREPVTVPEKVPVPA